MTDDKIPVNRPGRRADAVPILMLILGIIGIFVIVMVSDNAIRLTANAVLWTGWNVFWGAFLIAARIGRVV